MSELETKSHSVQSVLVVEDDPSVRDVLVSFLEIWGYRVSAAKDATEAIGMSVSRDRPDYLLCDLNLTQELDGLEVVKAFGQTKGRPETRAIIMTGNPEKLNSEIVRGVGDCTILSKPFRSDQLRQALTEVQPNS